MTEIFDIWTMNLKEGCPNDNFVERDEKFEQGSETIDFEGNHTFFNFYFHKLVKYFQVIRLIHKKHSIIIIDELGEVLDYAIRRIQCYIKINRATVKQFRKNFKLVSEMSDGYRNYRVVAMEVPKQNRNAIAQASIDLKNQRNIKTKAIIRGCILIKKSFLEIEN